MSAQNQTADLPLPDSHYFFTLSRGARTRTLAVRTGLARVAAAAILTAAVAGLGATLCLVFHDDLTAALMARQTRMQYAYEDKIDALRGELQRQTVRQLRDQSAIETRLRDLLSRASELQSRSDALAGLDSQASRVATQGRRGASPATTALDALASVRDPAGSTLSALPAAAAGYAPASRLPVGKPRPESDTGEAPAPAAASRAAGRVSALDLARFPVPARLSMVSASFDDVERSQRDALKEIESAARGESARLGAVLDEVGLSPDRFRRSLPSGQGGPFVPLDQGPGDDFGLSVAQTKGIVETALRLRDTIHRLPIDGPLAGQLEVTSPFGARVDPFLGRPALHTGVDLRGDYGASARATAAGRVVSAGPLGGYGNMVEIDHGAGLTSRYAHLTAILVTPGQTVGKGDVVGEVGATGRATGPHLHYEVRVDGAPVDPVRYLEAGIRLAQAGH